MLIWLPQGSYLGLLLFFVYINDLSVALKRDKATMYANDAAISSSSDNIEGTDADVLSTMYLGIAQSYFS